MNINGDNQSSRITRRKFLGTLGMGAVALGTSSILPAHAQQRFVIPEDRFGRLFPQLPAFFDRTSDSLRKALLELGKAGGILDAKDDLTAGPVALIVNPDLSKNNPNNPAHTAGTTFMGQFMDHDMTFDLTSRLGVPTRPEDSVNTRTPALDLDSVYGGGPSDDPELYTFERGHAPKFKIGFGGLFEDLPRTSKKTAIIADPRNDENLIIAGLHAAVLLFHNNAVDYVEDRDRRASSDEVFRRARRADQVALPVDDRARVSAALHRPVAGQRHPVPWTEILPAQGGVHSRRVPGRGVPLWPHDGTTLVPGESGG